MTDFEAIVRDLMERGVSRELAEKRARAALNLPVNRRVEAPRYVSRGGENVAFQPEATTYYPDELLEHDRAIDMIDAKPEVPLERDVRTECQTLYKRAGCVLYSTSQFRKAGTSPGLPDDFIFPPKGKGRGWWHEYKRPGGARSTEQEAFKQLCDESGTPYVCGGVEAARAMLRRRRISHS